MKFHNVPLYSCSYTPSYKKFPVKNRDYFLKTWLTCSYFLSLHLHLLTLPPNWSPCCKSGTGLILLLLEPYDGSPLDLHSTETVPSRMSPTLQNLPPPFIAYHFTSYSSPPLQHPSAPSSFQFPKCQVCSPLRLFFQLLSP